MPSCPCARVPRRHPARRTSRRRAAPPRASGPPDPTPVFGRPAPAAARRAAQHAPGRRFPRSCTLPARSFVPERQPPAPASCIIHYARAPRARRLHQVDRPIRLPPTSPRSPFHEEASCMAKNRKIAGKPSIPSTFDQARDELFSHILRCGVLEATPEHQKEWFDDTILYLAERYDDLAEEQLEQLRVLGERYCRPVVARPAPVGAV